MDKLFKVQINFKSDQMKIIHLFVFMARIPIQFGFECNQLLIFFENEYTWDLNESYRIWIHSAIYILCL